MNADELDVVIVGADGRILEHKGLELTKTTTDGGAVLSFVPHGLGLHRVSKVSLVAQTTSLHIIVGCSLHLALEASSNVLVVLVCVALLLIAVTHQLLLFLSCSYTFLFGLADVVMNNWTVARMAGNGRLTHEAGQRLPPAPPKVISRGCD